MAEKKEKKKLSVESIRIAKEKAGFKFTGKFLGAVKGEPFTKATPTGELVTKQLEFAVFEKDDGNRFQVIRDKGLLDAMISAMVKEGQKIEVVKLEKADIGNGRTMNRYDIFEA